MRLIREIFWSWRTPFYLLAFAIAAPLIFIAGREPWAVLGVKPVVVTGLSGERTKLKPCKPFQSPKIAYCGVRWVYEDREAGAGRRIAIHFTVSFAPAATRAPDPVFMIDGGPGVGKAVIAGFTIGKKAAIESRRDLVFIDIRGTGRSNPLSCIGLDGSPFQLATYFRGDPRLYLSLLSVQHYLGDQYDQSAMRACARRLEKRADLSKYTSSLAAADIDEIRQILGYERINLSGASYGTRLSLEYARRYPEAMRAMSLTDVVPPSLKMPSSFARSTERALDRLFENCARDIACDEAYPNLRGDLDKVLQRLEKAPARFIMKNPLLLGLVSEKVSMKRGPFVMGVRAMLYDYESLGRIPFVVSRAARGDFEPIAREIVKHSAPLELVLAKGMYLSDTCAEDAPFIDVERARAEANGTMLGAYRLDQHLGACAVWPRGRTPADWLEPVWSDAPTLLFNGELDPSTPPETGRDVASGLPNAKLIVMRNETHGAAANWESCGEALETQLFEEASVAHIDAACADEIEPAPFYVSE